MGVKRNRQGWCGPQAKPRTRPCLFRFRGKEAETPFPFNGWMWRGLPRPFCLQERMGAVCPRALRRSPEDTWGKMKAHPSSTGRSAEAKRNARSHRLPISHPACQRGLSCAASLHPCRLRDADRRSRPRCAGTGTRHSVFGSCRSSCSRIGDPFAVGGVSASSFGHLHQLRMRPKAPPSKARVEIKRNAMMFRSSLNSCGV